MRDANESSKMNSNKNIYAMMLKEISARSSHVRGNMTRMMVFIEDTLFTFSSLI